MGEEPSRHCDIYSCTRTKTIFRIISSCLTRHGKLILNYVSMLPISQTLPSPTCKALQEASATSSAAAGTLWEREDSAHPSARSLVWGDCLGESLFFSHFVAFEFVMNRLNHKSFSLILKSLQKALVLVHMLMGGNPDGGQGHSWWHLLLYLYLVLLNSQTSSEAFPGEGTGEEMHSKNPRAFIQSAVEVSSMSSTT